MAVQEAQVLFNSVIIFRAPVGSAVMPRQLMRFNQRVFAFKPVDSAKAER